MFFSHVAPYLKNFSWLLLKTLYTFILISYNNLNICILFGDDSKFHFCVIEYFVKKGEVFFYMSRCISKTIYDYCLKLYTLLCYINLKICILFGDDSKFYFWVIEYFVKKGRVFFTCRAVSQKQFMIIALNFTHFFVMLI